MKKLVPLICLSMLLLLLSIGIVFAGSIDISYSGENGSVEIYTSTPGYNDNFSMNAGGDFSGYHGVTAYTLSRVAEFSGDGDIYAATCASDMIVGIAIEGNTGYLREGIDVSSSLDANFLAWAWGCSYLIDSYAGDSSLSIAGIAMNLQGNGNGELGGDFSLYNPSLYANVYALGYGSGEFRLYVFAPYLGFRAEIWADSLYADVHMGAYDAWLDSYTTFDSYLKGYGSVASE